MASVKDILSKTTVQSPASSGGFVSNILRSNVAPEPVIAPQVAPVASPAPKPISSIFSKRATFALPKGNTVQDLVQGAKDTIAIPKHLVESVIKPDETQRANEAGMFPTPKNKVAKILTAPGRAVGKVISRLTNPGVEPLAVDAGERLKFRQLANKAEKTGDYTDTINYVKQSKTLHKAWYQILGDAGQAVLTAYAPAIGAEEALAKAPGKSFIANLLKKSVATGLEVGVPFGAAQVASQGDFRPKRVAEILGTNFAGGAAFGAAGAIVGKAIEHGKAAVELHQSMTPKERQAGFIKNPLADEEVPKTPQEILAEAEKKAAPLGLPKYSKDTPVLKGFENSKPVETIGDFELGTFGKNAGDRKALQVDRFSQKELPETIKNITESYRASNDPYNYRVDNTAHIAEMPNGEKRVIYTRENANGKEEIINWHSLSKERADAYIASLKNNGIPERNRTSNRLVRTEMPSPLGHGNDVSIAPSIPEVKPDINKNVKLSAEGISLALTKNERLLLALERAKNGEEFGPREPGVDRVKKTTVREGPMKISIPRDQLSEELAGRQTEIEATRAMLENSPLKPMLKYVQRRGEFAGQLPEVTGKGGRFSRMGDQISSEAMPFHNEGGSEGVREQMQKYIEARKSLEIQERQFREDVQTYREKEKSKILAQKDESTLNRLANKDLKESDKNMRIEERRRAFEEGRQRAIKEAGERDARKQAIYDAHAVPPKRLNFIQKIRARLFPAKYLDDKASKIFMDWERGLIEAKVLANKEVGTLKNIPGGRKGFEIMLDYEAGKKTGYNTEIQNAFDKLFHEANARGLDTPYVQDYLPHVYVEHGREMSEKIQKYLTEEKGMSKEEANSYLEGKGLNESEARRLSLTPFFSKERVFPTYKVAMQYGLTPKFAHPDQLVAYYREQLEKTLANIDFITKLQENSKILTVEDAPASWKPVELPFSYKGYYAEPRLAETLNGVFHDPENATLFETVSGKIAGLSRKAQEIALSGGVPYTNINFFSIGQAIKDITAGKFSSAGAWLRANFNGPSIKFLRRNQDIIEKMSEDGIDLSSNIANYKRTYKNIVENDNKGFLKKWFNIAGEQFDKAFNEKTFNSYMPQVQIQLYKSVYEKALGQGMSEEIARSLAGETTKTFYGLTEKQGRAPATENTLSSLFFAPKFREGIVNTLFNTAKSVTSELRNPVFRNNRKLFAGMALTYGLYNLLNHKLNGTYMWDNPPGRESALRIPGKDGTTTYLEFMPSFLSFARNIFSGAIGLGKGDFDTAKQKFGSVFSMPVQIATEVLANKDYFGNEIYDPLDSGFKKTKAIAQYVGLAVSHPYVQELVKQAEHKKPLYQSIVSAFEIPLKFGSISKEQQGQYYDMLDQQEKDHAKAMDKVRPIYEKIKAVYDSGDVDTGDKMAEALTPEQRKLYSSIVISEKRKATQKAERDMYTRVIDLKKMYDSGQEDEADAIIEGMSDEEKRIYTLVVNKLHRGENDVTAADQEDNTDISTE